MNQTKIRVGLLNVQSGIGTTKGYYQYLLHLHRRYWPHGSSRIQRLGELSKKAGIDILATTEIDRGSLRTRRKDQVKLLSKSSNLANNAFFSTFTIGRFANQGNAVHTRFKIFDKHNFKLPGIGEPRYAGRLRVKINKKTVNFFVTHLSLDLLYRREQINELAAIINRESSPVILAGDFNVNDVKELGMLEKSKLRDVFSAETYPVWNPKKNLDHIFVSNDVKLSSGRVSRVPLSDHCLLIADVYI